MKTAIGLAVLPFFLTFLVVWSAAVCRAQQNDTSPPPVAQDQQSNKVVLVAGQSPATAQVPPGGSITFTAAAITVQGAAPTPVFVFIQAAAPTKTDTVHATLTSETYYDRQPDGSFKNRQGTLDMLSATHPVACDATWVCLDGYEPAQFYGGTVSNVSADPVTIRMVVAPLVDKAGPVFSTFSLGANSVGTPAPADIWVVFHFDHGARISAYLPASTGTPASTLSWYRFGFFEVGSSTTPFPWILSNMVGDQENTPINATSGQESQPGFSTRFDTNGPDRWALCEVTSPADIDLIANCQ